MKRVSANLWYQWQAARLESGIHNKEVMLASLWYQLAMIWGIFQFFFVKSTIIWPFGQVMVDSKFIKSSSYLRGSPQSNEHVCLGRVLRVEAHPSKTVMTSYPRAALPANPEDELCFSIPGPKRRAGHPPGKPAPASRRRQSRDASALIQLGETLEQAVNTTKYMSRRPERDSPRL
jgi:hypothetical protein